MKLRILILIFSSVVFCTSNAMAPKVDTLDALIALLPDQSQHTSSSSRNNTATATQNSEQQIHQLVVALYRDHHFEKLSKLKQNKRKKN